MSFFDTDSNSIAVITPNGAYTYHELPKVTFESSQKELIFIVCRNTIEILASYVSALNSGHAVMLMSADTNDELLKKIINTYQPKWIVGLKAVNGYVPDSDKLVRQQQLKVDIHPDLALLLSTSGTTGSQKFVRLSYKNIRSNAESIIEYLNIHQNERAIMNLPLSYSYGMSIVNSHLLAGASILLTEQSVIEKSFWDFVKKHKATSLAGVPFTYQMLSRIGFFKMDLPNLKTLTQAGGHLHEKFVRMFAEYAEKNGKRFYVMYGQTEASPRISYIPPERVLEKTNSIGIAIPGGELSLDSETGELIYKGPNVMMGYAESLDDLAKGDELHGILHTGDIATVDEEGYYTIIGRKKRFIKLFGLRINLDEVERKLQSVIQTNLACTGTDDKLIIALEDSNCVEKIKSEIEQLYHLHKTAYKVVVLEQIPRFPNGKTDYRTLKEQCL